VRSTTELTGSLDFGRFTLDLDSRLLIDPAGQAVALRRREFDLLLTLAGNPGRVMSRATLLDAIAGREAEAFDRTIDVYIGRLRRKIETDPKQPQLIITVPGVGYRLAAKPKVSHVLGQEHDERAAWAGLGILSAYNKASFEHDPEALAALYTKEATHIVDGTPVSGRAAIEKWQRGICDRKDYCPNPSRLERVVAIGDNAMLRSGTWSATHQSENGLVSLSGGWTTTDLCDHGTWKICTETCWFNSAPVRPAVDPATFP
jgi:DNA-binding winged helix-turn-helix (wHTH) protein